MSDEVNAGSRLGSLYVLDQRIGSGGMGTVWAARNTETGQPFAVKILSENLAQDPDLVGRFLRERSALMSVHHPNLVQIHDLVVENRRVALVMDLVQGIDAARLLEQSGPMPLRQAAGIGAEIANALGAVHAAGIVHRDLKPANILIESGSGRARLVDFGIAWIAGNPRLTAVNSVVGTPHYLAPELLTGGQVSPAADVYALAICLYQFLSGVVPFDGDHYAQILQKHLNEAPRPHPAIPATLWGVIEVMLAKDPAMRPDMQFVARQLTGFAGGSDMVPALFPQPVPPQTTVLPARYGSTPVPGQYPPTPVPGSGSVPQPYQDGDAFFPGTGIPPVPAPWPPAGGDGFTPNPPPFQYQEPEPRNGRGKLVLALVCVLVLCGVGAGTWALTSGGGGSKPKAEASTPSGSLSTTSSATVAPKSISHHWTLCCGQLQEAGGTTSATDSGVQLNSAKQGDAVFNGKAGTQIAVDGPVIDTEQSFTIAFWMNMNGSTSTTSGRETMVEQRGAQACAACVSFDPGTGRLVFRMQSADTPGAGGSQVVALAAPSPKSWYRIIVSYDASFHTMSMYINGTLQGTATFDASWVPTGPLTLGSGLEDGASSDWYAGSLADLWLWNKAMDPAEVDKAAK